MDTRWKKIIDERDGLIMGYFDNLDNGLLSKYKKIKIEKNYSYIYFYLYSDNV
jgi:hypothetical protein